MASRGRNRITVVVTLVAAGMVLLADPSDGQIFDDPFGVTTTTTPADPASSTTTEVPSSEDPTTTTSTTTTTAAATEPPPPAPAGEATPPPPGAQPPPDGDGTAPPAGAARATPPEAQRIIDGVQRTPPNSSADLLAAVQQLVDLGLTQEEAIRIGFGRFPVAGEARYSHDWLYPRWGPGFRFHLGTDVFAAHGTPLRAPVDGVVRSSNNSLGGLSVKIFMDDGTFFYFAHMSGLVEGFTDGMPVRTGDIVGYVGDSGNARGGSPHLHIAVHPRGGDATDPKPILDQFLADAMAQLPHTVEQVKASLAATSPTTAAVPAPSVDVTVAAPWRAPRRGDVPTEVLYQTTGNPSAGGVSVARAEAERLAAGIDWDAWARRSTSARTELARRTEDALRTLVGPLLGRTAR